METGLFRVENVFSSGKAESASARDGAIFHFDILTGV